MERSGGQLCYRLPNRLDSVDFLMVPLILAIIVSLSGCGSRDEQRSLGEMSDEVIALSLQGRWAEAARLSEDIAKQSAEMMGVRSPQYALALPRIAVCYGSLGRWREADSLYALSIEILTQYPPCDSMRAKVLYERSTVWMIWKDYATAESLLVESLRLSTEVCDQNSPIVFLANERLADCRAGLGDFDGGVAILERVCRDLCAMSSAPDTNCLYPISCLAKGYLQLKRYAAVESLVQSTLDMYPSADSVSARLTADMMLSLAVARYEMQKRQVAADDFLRALRLAERVYGHESPALLDYLQNAAISLKGLKKYDEALLLRRRALAITEKKYGQSDSLLIPILEGIARDLRSLNREGEAREVEARVKALASPPR